VVILHNPNGSRRVSTSGDEHFHSLRDLLQIIWKRLWLILLPVIVLVGGSVGFSLIQTPMYEASNRLLVGQSVGESKGFVSDSPANAADLQKLTATMASGVQSRPVVEAAFEELDIGPTWHTPDDLLAHLRAEPEGNTQFVKLTYRDGSPENAQQIVDTIGDAFTERIDEVNPYAISVSVWERAEVPDNPVSPNWQRNALLALALGVILGVGLAFLVESLGNSWRSPEEAEQISGYPTLSVVPRFEKVR
jgi:capsular polysaccharide biosynthesis protein